MGGQATFLLHHQAGVEHQPVIEHRPVTEHREERGRYEIERLPLQVRKAHIMEARYPRLRSDPDSPEVRFIPWLNLRGHWLDQAGFFPGRRIRVEVHDNKLIITADQ